MGKTVKDLMTSPVISINKESSVFDAASTISENNISCVVVVEEGKITGILTLKDIVDKVVVKRRNIDELTVDMVMTPNVKTIDENRDVVVAAGTMSAMHIKQLPVEKDGKLVGIITQTDLVEYHKSLFG